MFVWVLVLLLVAVVAAVFAFTEIATSAAGIAEVIFFVAVILAVLGFVIERLRGGPRS